MKPFNYAIIKENHPELERETVLLKHKYEPKKKFAIICKTSHKDGSESIGYIRYEDDLLVAHFMAEKYKSWYNYPLGIAKTLKGDLISI